MAMPCLVRDQTEFFVVNAAMKASADSMIASTASSTSRTRNNPELPLTVACAVGDDGEEGEDVGLVEVSPPDTEPDVAPDETCCSCCCCWRETIIDLRKSGRSFLLTATRPPPTAAAEPTVAVEVKDEVRAEDDAACLLFADLLISTVFGPKTCAAARLSTSEPTLAISWKRILTLSL